MRGSQLIGAHVTTRLHVQMDTEDAVNSDETTLVSARTTTLYNTFVLLAVGSLKCPVIIAYYRVFIS